MNDATNKTNAEPAHVPIVGSTENQATGSGTNPSYMGESVNPLGVVVEALKPGANTAERESMQYLLERAGLERQQEKDAAALKSVQEADRRQQLGAQRQRWLVGALMNRIHIDTRKLMDPREVAEHFNIYMSPPDVLANQEEDAWIQIDLLRRRWAPIRASIRLALGVESNSTSVEFEGFTVLAFEHYQLRDGAKTEPQTMIVEWKEPEVPRPSAFPRACLDAKETGGYLASLWAKWVEEGFQVQVR